MAGLTSSRGRFVPGMGVGMGALAVKSSIGVGGTDRKEPESAKSMSKAIRNGAGDSGRVPPGKVVVTDRVLNKTALFAEPGTGKGEEWCTSWLLEETEGRRARYSKTSGSGGLCSKSSVSEGVIDLDGVYGG
jgi:hypothetical protein